MFDLRLMKLIRSGIVLNAFHVEDSIQKKEVGCRIQAMTSGDLDISAHTLIHPILIKRPGLGSNLIRCVAPSHLLTNKVSVATLQFNLDAQILLRV